MEVFLSFSTDDAQVAHRLYRDLESAGASVFHFGEEGVPGSPAWQQVVDRIHRADSFLLLVSASSVASPAVLEELRIANYRFLNGKKPTRIIPLLLDSTDPPALIEHRTRLSLENYSYGLQRLVVELGLGSPRNTEQEPDAGPKPPANFSRRAALLGAGGLASSLILFWQIPTVVTFLQCEGSPEPQPGRLIRNARSGAVHHIDVCMNHLPSSSNREAGGDLSASSLHRSERSRIFARVADTLPPHEAAELLLAAVNENSTAIHLYDRLVRLFGMMQRYEAIHSLLDRSIRALSEEAGRLSAGSKRRARVERAVKALQARQRAALRRAEVAVLESQ